LNGKIGRISTEGRWVEIRRYEGADPQVICSSVTWHLNQDKKEIIQVASSGWLDTLATGKHRPIRRGPVKVHPESARQSGVRRDGNIPVSNCQSLNCSGPSERAKRRVAPRVMQSNAGGTASPDKTGGVVVLCKRHRPPADLHQRFPGPWLSNGGWNWRKRARERRMFCSTRSCALVKAGGVLRRSRHWRDHRS
jgi:hypothetical protein